MDRRPPEVLRRLLDRAEAQLGPDPAAQDTLAWAAAEFGTRLVVASSMTDAVLAHLAARALPGVQVVFVDTGFHFPETLAYRDRVARLLPITMVSELPPLSTHEQSELYGPDLAGTHPTLCCRLRKVGVMDRALRRYEAWAAGVRRADSPGRAVTRALAWDDARGLIKINPIAGWSDDQVAEYVERHALPANPLLGLGYASIGCAPCTSPVDGGEHARAGRWPGHAKTECGIHSHP